MNTGTGYKYRLKRFASVAGSNSEFTRVCVWGGGGGGGWPHLLQVGGKCGSRSETSANDTNRYLKYKYTRFCLAYLSDYIYYSYIAH